jgi:hypothetical protein
MESEQTAQVGRSRPRGAGVFEAGRVELDDMISAIAGIVGLPHDLSLGSSYTEILDDVATQIRWFQEMCFALQ